MVERPAGPPSFQSRNLAWFDKRAPAKLEGVSTPAFAAIKALQPCVRWESDSDRRRDPLHLINELDIIDKHHLLHVAAATPSTGSWDAEQVHLDAGMRVRLTMEPLYDGAEIMRFSFSKPCTDIVKAAQDTLQIMVAETEQTPYLPFPTDLRILHRATSRAVATLAATSI
jgi:hypothetical protein